VSIHDRNAVIGRMAGLLSDPLRQNRAKNAYDASRLDLFKPWASSEAAHPMFVGCRDTQP
jgi:hypothetical protein